MFDHLPSSSFPSSYLLASSSSSSSSSASSSSSPGDSALLDYLFSGYDRRIRPLSEGRVPVLVELTIVLAILTELVSDWLDSIPLRVPAPFDPLVIPH